MSANIETDIQRFLKEVLALKGDWYTAWFRPFAPRSVAEFAFLQDSSLIDAAAQFAIEANNIPARVGDWVITGSLLWREYQRWLEAAEFPPRTLDEHEREKLRLAEEYCAAHAERYFNYWELAAAAESDARFWRQMPLAQRPPDYAERFAAAEEAERSALKAWNELGDRENFERNVEIVRSLARADMGQVRYRLIEQPLGFRRTSISFGTFYWTTLLPSNFLETGFTWSSMYFDTLAAGGSQRSGPWKRLAGRRPGMEEPFSASWGKTRIEFDMMRVTVWRGWFAPEWLGDRCWKWYESTRQNPEGMYPLSTGGMDPTGHLIAYPTEAVFLRNVRVTAQDAEALLAGSPDDTVGVGPLVLGPIRGISVDRVPGGDRLTSSQLQLAGYICRLLPKSPNPDWPLWPPS